MMRVHMLRFCYTLSYGFTKRHSGRGSAQPSATSPRPTSGGDSLSAATPELAELAPSVVLHLVAKRFQLFLLLCPSLRSALQLCRHHLVDLLQLAKLGVHVEDGEPLGIRVAAPATRRRSARDRLEPRSQSLRRVVEHNFVISL